MPKVAPAGPDFVTQVRAAHARWRADVHAALAPATADQANVWDRARAAHDLETGFMPTFQREHRAIEMIGSSLAPDQARPLWALGELLALLHSRLTDLVIYSQCGATFAAAAGKLEQGLADWCERVEEVVSRGATIPPDVRGLLTSATPAAETL